MLIIGACSNDSFPTVLYSAQLGGSGVDTDDLQDRFAVFWETRTLQDMGEERALAFMDEGDPFHPESAYYAVARLTRGIFVL